MIVHVPTPLRSSTGERATVDGEGRTPDDVLRSLDRRYPGMRFRIVDEVGRLRPHIKLFIGLEPTQDLGAPLDGAGEVHIICALSGG